MQSFYLTNIDKKHNFERLNSFLNIYKEIKISEKINLYLFHSTGKESFYKMEKIFYATLVFLFIKITLIKMI